MIFDPDKINKKADWSKLGSMILSNKNMKFKNTITELNKIKEKNQKNSLSKNGELANSLLRSAKKAMKAKNFQPKKSYVKRLHRDSLARKIFNINYKRIGVFL